MREITKKYYFFTKKDKEAFDEWCKTNHVKKQEFAKKLGIAKSLLSQYLFGRRAISEEKKLAFKNAGYEL